MADEAQLGLASNEEMLRELITRFELDGSQNHVGSFLAIRRATQLAEMLGGMVAVEREYRTVDHG